VIENRDASERPYQTNMVHSLLGVCSNFF